jgi:hypothetical protein
MANLKKNSNIALENHICYVKRAFLLHVLFFFRFFYFFFCFYLCGFAIYHRIVLYTIVLFYIMRPVTSFHHDELLILMS